MNFNTLKQAVATQFAAMGKLTLYRTAATPDSLWEVLSRKENAELESKSSDEIKAMLASL